MIIGLDIGASATKVAGYESEKVLFTHTENGKSVNLDTLLRGLLAKNGYTVDDVKAVALTGVGAESCDIRRDVVPVCFIPEIEATGEGGTWLSGRSEAVVVSLGTGTALVLAKHGVFTHIGGSGVGSGTVRGLAKKLSQITDMPEYFALAEKGDLTKIDIQIGDLFSGTDTLPLDLTASNLAKCRDDGSEADWAAGIINMALEVAGSHAALACGGYGVGTVVITGGLSQTAIATSCYAKFDRLYDPEFLIPEHSGCATAIGAARRAFFGKQAGDKSRS